MSRTTDEFLLRRVVMPRAIAGMLIVVAVGLLLAAGLGSLFMNTPAAAGVSLLVVEMPLPSTR
jgi:hypothetical protein